MNTVISYPIPAFSNVPIQDITQPGFFFISAITLGITTLIETSVDHNYVIGQQVRLIVPQSYGTYQLTGRTGYVLAIPSADRVILDIFSIGMSPFVMGSGPVAAQIIAIGDINSGAINDSITTQGTSIPGAFEVNN